MYEEVHTRSPDRGGDRESNRFRSRNIEDRDDYYQSRKDYSRSPSRHDYYDNSRESYDRRHSDMRRGGGHHGYYRGANNAYARDGGHSRDNRRSHSNWDDNNQGEFYDDDYHRGRSREGRRDDNLSHSRHRGAYMSRSPAGGYRSRSRSRSGVRDAGRPSDTIILEGLPPNVSENELRQSILTSAAAAQFPPPDVRLSFTGGNYRAFVQFGEFDHAVAFVKEHFPQLLITLSYPTDEFPDGSFKAFIHYARGRGETDVRAAPGANWTCGNCNYSNFASRSKCKTCGSAPSEMSLQQSLNPAADTSQDSSQMLIIFPLPHFVDEDKLASEMKQLEIEKVEPAKETAKGGPFKLKSTAPISDPSRHGGKPGSIHRVFIMRDPKTRESLKYGFVEFWTLEDAMAAMAKVRMSRKFTVAGQVVTVSHIHLGVFVPDERYVSPQTEHLSFYPLFNNTLRVRYRDLRAYPSSLQVTQEPLITNDAPSKSPENDENSEGKKSKKRKAEGAVGAASAKKPAAMIFGSWQKKHEEIHSKSSEITEASPSDQSSTNATTSNSQRAPIKFSITGASMLNAPPPPSDIPPPPPPPEEPGKDAPEDKVEAALLYMDKLQCLLCLRKFKSMDEVNIHVKSRKHTGAMGDEELVKQATKRLANRGIQIQTTTAEDAETSSGSAAQYRDRAKERREAYNQPKKPSGQANQTKVEGGKPHNKDDTKAAAATESKPAQSKGASILAKMGWTTGSGLGADGDGRTDVIATDAYQVGVGLGVEGGKLGDAAELAEKKTRGSYTEYVNTVQDKARERYNQLQK